MRALEAEVARLKEKLERVRRAKKTRRRPKAKKPKKPKKVHRPSKRRRIGRALRLLTRAEERAMPLESVYQFIAGETDLTPREVFTLGRSPDLADDLSSDLWMGDTGT